MKVLYALLILVPVAILIEVLGIGGHTVVFVVSALALIPLAAVLGQTTEEVGIYTGPTIGSLLTATLGNAAELIITIVALKEGLVEVVKASIAGAVIGNILVVLGLSLFFGGIKNGEQSFDPKRAGTNATIMTLAVLALLIPAIFSLGAPGHRPSDHDIEDLSDGLAIVLIILYVLYLLFTLKRPHGAAAGEGEPEEPSMRLSVAIGVLAATTIAIVVVSELMVGALEPTAESWGLTDLFVGVMLLPLAGSIAEQSVAVRMAVANKMELSLGIAVGSGLQIALFVTPVLVFAGVILNQPMTLVFDQFELIALFVATLIAGLISIDGKSNWLEGAELLALYAIIGIAFYFVP
jgi:Ca2+:H+ antiporter